MEKVINGMFLSSELVILDLEASSRDELLNIMSKKLVSKKMVKDSFPDAIIERENVYATGLMHEGIGFAIPHTDVIHVKKQTISIGILKNPITFNEMGSNKKVEVSLVFMLAIKEPHQQVKFLQAMMQAFQNKESLLMIKNCENTEDVIQKFGVMISSGKGGE